jgi:tellurite resistance protein TerC
MKPDRQNPQKAPAARGDMATVAACAGMGLAFGALVLAFRGPGQAQQYYSAYLIELGLSVDNLFVFTLVFERFRVPDARRSRLLFAGVAGAAVMRTALLLAGVGAVRRFAWLVPVLGAVILATGARLLFSGRGRTGLGPASRVAPAGLAALVAVEAADLVFALDSIPAVLAVTRDPFVAVSSNLFALLGLRSLYALVGRAMRRLRHLNLGIAAILAFVGLKMLAEPWLPVPPGASLAVIAAILVAAVAASLAPRRR